MADEVTIVSTTDSEADVRSALGADAAAEMPKADEQGNAAVSADAAVDAKGGAPLAADAAAAESDSDDDAAGDGGDTSEAGKKLAKRKRSLQERINELTHDKYATVRERDAAVAEVARLNALLETVAKAPAKPQPSDARATAAKPKVEDFQTYEDFVEALADWKADQKATARAGEVKKEIDDRLAAERQADVDQATARAQQQILTSYAARVDEFRKTHPDLNAALEQVDSDEYVVPPMMRAHILQSDIGPALQYHLAKNPDDFRRIAALPPGPMLVQLGKLEARLDVATPGPTSAAAPVTRATPPIKPVGGSATASTVPLDELPYQDYKKRREAEIAARRR
jgi:hypothetical protein